jgi:hypothetical protein
MPSAQSQPWMPSPASRPSLSFITPVSVEPPLTSCHYCQLANAVADCGTTLVLDEEVREMLKKRVPERGDEIEKMSFGEITE